MSSSIFFWANVFLTVLCSSCQEYIVGDSKSDLVQQLPGANFNLPYSHYSGFLQSVNESRLHYWFFESANSPQHDPLILWLNGGPGCSSLIGALTEIGPIRLTVDGKVQLNPHSWNENANLLFLETPIGVGFSHVADGKKMPSSINDDQTAELNMQGLISFFSKFPQLIDNDFYLAGESYAGVYIPMLSELLISRKYLPNFKGVVIGNGYLDRDRLRSSRLHFLYHHGIVGVEEWESLTEACCPAMSASKLRNCDFFADDRTAQCVRAREKFRSPVDPYNIYDSSSSSGLSWIKHSTWNRALNFFQMSTGSDDFNFDTHSFIGDYLNQAIVRQILHVESSPNVWESCQKWETYYQQQYPNMRRQIQSLLSSKINVVIYNGDLDTVCDFLGTQWFVRDLEHPPLTKFEPWYYGDFLIGGMAQEYEQNLAFVTILGAGHMAPADKPEASLNMLRKFVLKNE